MDDQHPGPEGPGPEDPRSDATSRFPAPQGPQGGWAEPPKHPQATTVLVLGILGLVLCQVLSPVAWYMANQALREIDARPGVHGGRSEVNAGRILGIVGTALLAVVGVLLVLSVIFVIFGLALFAGSVGEYESTVSLVGALR